jgi:hypothetical protein
MKYLVVLITAGLFFSSCVRYQKNPAYIDCITQCRDAKNKCMVKAGTGDAVTKCDTVHNECMQNCSVIPVVVPVENK